MEAELALDEAGKFLAVRGANLSNLGGHALSFVSLQKGIGLMTGVYQIPAAYFRGRGALTNTVPTTPYRSAGRPEVMFVIERLVDLAADRLGIDPAALRRRNMIPPGSATLHQRARPHLRQRRLPGGDGTALWSSPIGTALRARRAEARRRGRYRGIGLANYVEITSGFPRERTEITVLPEGRVELVMGTMSSGQGHETSFAQLVTEWLGVPFDSIDYVAHDTARVAAGGGSHSGRSMKLATTIIGQATDDIIDKGRKIASVLLEAGEARYRIRPRPLSRRRHRSCDRLVRGGGSRGDAPRPAGRAARHAGGGVRPDAAGREFSLRCAGVRGRGRCRDRCGRDRRLRRGGRCRPRDQPDDRAWADAWRHCSGRRPGVAGEQPL